MVRVTAENNVCKFYCLAYLYILDRITPFNLKNYLWVVRDLRVCSEEVPKVFGDKAESLGVVKKLISLGFTVRQANGEAIKLPSFREFSNSIDPNLLSTRFYRLIRRYRRYESYESFIASDHKFEELLRLPEVLTGLKRCADAKPIKKISKSKSSTRSKVSKLERETDKESLMETPVDEVESISEKEVSFDDMEPLPKQRNLGYQSSYFQVFCKYIVVGNGSMFVELNMLNLNEVKEFLIELCFVLEDYKSESWTFELNGKKFDDVHELPESSLEKPLIVHIKEV